MSTSNPGVLKMVKVKRSRRGHKKSRSLVFRISRTVPKSSQVIQNCSSFDDSGIQSATPKDEISSDDQEENPSGSLKLKIPKFLVYGNKEAESKATESAEDLASENGDGHSELSVAKSELIHSKSSVTKSELRHSESPVTELDPKHSELSVAKFDPKPSESSSTNVVFLNYNDDALSSNTTQTITGTPGRKVSGIRRSSRRILLLQKKDFEPNTSMDQISSIRKVAVVSSSRNSGQSGRGNKRRRMRKSETPVIEVKKRKYTRRGRPPKSPAFGDLSAMKPYIVGSVPKDGENFLFDSSNNSVWTLVPKELFQSDFFQSHVLKILSRSSEKKYDGDFNTPPSLPSYAATPPDVPFHDEEKQLNIPGVNVNSMPTMQQRFYGDFKDCKRPTVIYFNKEKQRFNYPDKQQVEFRDRRPLFNNNEFNKTQNDLLCLFNKYRTVEDSVLKNYYESASGDLDGTQNTIPELCSKSQEETNPWVTQNNVTGTPVPEFGSNDVNLHYMAMEDFSGSVTSRDDVDTLSRCIIIESLGVLFSEDAVLP